MTRKYPCKYYQKGDSDPNLLKHSFTHPVLRELRGHTVDKVFKMEYFPSASNFIIMKQSTKMFQGARSPSISKSKVHHYQSHGHIDILSSKIHTREERDSLLSIHHKGGSSNSEKDFMHEDDHQLWKQKGIPQILSLTASLRKLHSFLRLNFLICKTEDSKIEKNKDVLLVVNVLFWQVGRHGSSMGRYNPTKETYQFPIVMKKCHKFSGLKRHRLILIQFSRPEI